MVADAAVPPWVGGTVWQGAGRAVLVTEPQQPMLDRYADARVLVIDDVAANVMLLERILTRAGLRGVHGYTDPRLAVAELEQTRPDLVVTDLRMPHVCGEQVLAAVAAHAAGTYRYLPVLVVTADATSAAVRQVLQAAPIARCP